LDSSIGRFPTVPAGHPITIINPTEDELAFVDEATGQVHNVLKGDMRRVQAVIAARNQKTLATFNNDGTKTIWHTTEDGKSLAFQLTGKVFGVACSPDGRMVATGFSDGGIKVRVWDAAAQKEIGTFDGYLSGNGFFPDSRTLVTVTANRIKLWDLATHRALQPPTGMFYSIAISPDGKTLATSDATQRVTLWDAATGQKRASLRLAGGGDGIVFSPEGSKVWLRHIYQDSRAAGPFYWLDDLFRRLGMGGFAFGSSALHEETSVFDAITGLECARVPSDGARVFFADDKTLATFWEVRDTNWQQYP
jgi:WD40 repeat protein